MIDVCDCCMEFGWLTYYPETDNYHCNDCKTEYVYA